MKIFWFYLVHFFVQIYYKSNIQKKWTWWNWNISLTNTSHLKSDRCIKMLMKFPLIWYIVGFCTSNVGLFFWIWIRKYFQIENWWIYSFLQFQFFYVLFYISFNFSPTKIYYRPNSSKCYEDFEEFSHFLLTALDNELQPRKPVHFFSAHPLFIIYIINANFYCNFVSQTALSLR